MSRVPIELINSILLLSFTLRIGILAHFTVHLSYCSVQLVAGYAPFKSGTRVRFSHRAFWSVGRVAIAPGCRPDASREATGVQILYAPLRKSGRVVEGSGLLIRSRRPRSPHVRIVPLPLGVGRVYLYSQEAVICLLHLASWPSGSGVGPQLRSRQFKSARCLRFFWWLWCNG
jgi:hypothetical protein